VEHSVKTRMITGWVLYDWANSAFATTIMAAILPAFYSQVAAANLAPSLASSYWGYTNTTAMLSIALLAPIMGAIADYKAAKKRFLAFFAVIGMLTTACLVTVGSGMWLVASIYYILGRIGFAGANIFYDALLPHVAPPGRMDHVSTLGYAVGYCGGGLLLAVNLAMISFPHGFGIANAEWGARYAFLSVAIWWALFSLPLFVWVPEPAAPPMSGSRINAVVAGLRRLQETGRHLRHYRQAMRFLLAFWLYNDGIGTIIVMAVIFGIEIGIGQNDLIAAILVVQFIGIPCSLGFGPLAKRLGAKRAIYLGLAVYVGIALGGYFLRTAGHFWLLAIAVASVQGGTQALSRSLYGRLIPLEKSAEFFGFYDISQKFSGIVGPAIFALIGQLTGSSRLGIVALIVFFLGGGAILMTVTVEEGERVTT
jgi:UMF1 family MFS transporter